MRRSREIPTRIFGSRPTCSTTGEPAQNFLGKKIERDFTESPSECGLNIAYERVDPEILSGSANPVLAEKIAKLLGAKLAPRILERCPDGELHIEIQQSVHGFLARAGRGDKLGAKALKAKAIMTEAEINKIVRQALSHVAPEVDLDRIDPTKDLRDQIDIDSVDFLNFVIGLHKELNVDIPDADVSKLATLKGCAAYLAAKPTGR